MAKTTKRIQFYRTVTYIYTADMVGYGSDTDANALTVANQTNGTNAIGELLSGSTGANGTVSKSSWAVYSSGYAIEPYNIWSASLPVSVGTRHIPTANSNRMHIVTTAGATGTTEPTWTTTIGNTTSSGTVTYRCIDKFGVVGTYVASSYYSAGTVWKPTAGSTAEYLVTTAGTTSGTPSWPGVVGSSVSSGTATFLCIAV